MIALGAMSGTSTDGVDVAAVQIDSKTQDMRFLGVLSAEFPPALRETPAAARNPASFSFQFRSNRDFLASP